MLRLHKIKGKTIRQWAEEDLPYGAFAEMVREADPVYGIYAPAGAQLKTYIAEGEGRINDDEEYEDDWYEEIEAYHAKHAYLVAIHDLKMPAWVEVRAKEE